MNHQYKDLYIDTRTKRVFRQGQEVHLTCTEYRLLLVLLGNVGRVFSREELLRRVWGITVPVRTRTVDIHIARLRRKLGLREEIRAVMRKGYALRPPAAHATLIQQNRRLLWRKGEKSGRLFCYFVIYLELHKLLRKRSFGP